MDSYSLCFIASFALCLIITPSSTIKNYINAKLFADDVKVYLEIDALWQSNDVIYNFKMAAATLHTTSGFVFDDVILIRRSKSLRKPNFVEVS